MNQISTPLSRVLPPALVRDWLRSRGPLFAGDFVFSGQSIRYFLAGLPVVVLETDREALDSLAARFQPGSRSPDEPFPELREIRPSRGELKLILILEEREFHFLIREREWSARGAVISIDRLRMSLDPGSWNGAAADLDDLASGLVRAIEPGAFTSADAYRLAALCAMTDFDLEPNTRQALRSAFNPAEVNELDPRFLQKHFRKLVMGRRPSRGFEVLREIGALSVFLPELAGGIGLAQNRYHRHDIYYHSIYACDAAELEIGQRLSALFHDLGKVDTREEQPDGEATFHNHEIVSTRHTENIMRRLAFPGALKKRVKFLVRNHMFHYTDAWSDRAIRRFMKRVNMDQLEDLIALRLADRKGSGKRSELPRAIKELMRHIQEVKKRDAEIKVRDLALNGHHLQAMGMRPGPEMGRVLKLLLEEVRDGRLPNEEAALRDRAGEYLNAGSAVPAGVPKL